MLYKEEAERLFKLKSSALESSITTLPISEEPSAIVTTTAEAGASDAVASTLQSRGSAPINRRQSKISLSTLHRSPFPLKLDLSSSTLRLSMDEVSKGLTALGSPVTLAPKSARPTTSNEIPPEILAALAAAANADHTMDMDLTLDDHISASGDINAGFRVHSELGNSPNKPIELDMDLDMETHMSDVNMTDIFGDSVETGSGNADIDSLFTPATPSIPLPAQSQNEEPNMDMSILDALSTVNESGSSNDLFRSINIGLGANTDALVTDASSKPSHIPGIIGLTRGSAELSDSHNSAGTLPVSNSFLYDSGTLNIGDIPNFSSDFFSNNDSDVDLMNTILNINESMVKSDRDQKAVGDSASQS